MVDHSKEQKAYINSSITEHVYLEACPGSGKTEVVAAKVVKEIDQWNQFPSGMAVLSFANSATDELKDRIAKYRKLNTSYYPHFVGTFDSFILKNIVSPLAHVITGYSGKDGDYSIRVVENSSPIYILTKYAFARRKLRANQYDYDYATEGFLFSSGEKSWDNALNSLVLEDWQINHLQEKKSLFLKSGFATYRDVEHLAIELLKEKKVKEYIKLVVQKFPLIIIDECQDLSHEQIYILELLTNLGIKLHFIGDLNQAIYGFRNADPQKVSDFIDKLRMTKLPLTKNYRSGQQIVNVCNVLVPTTKIEGQKDFEENNCLILEYNDNPKEVIPKFLELSNKHEVRVIVARGYTTLNKFLNSATKLNTVEKLAQAIVIYDQNNILAIERSLNLFSEYLRNYIKKSESVRPNSFNCPESIKSSLEWRTFLFLAITHLANKGLANQSMNWKDWCKKVKTELRLLTKEEFVDEKISELLIELSKVNHSAPAGKGTNSIGDTLKAEREQNHEPLKLTTIHKVKGQTHDATMLISSARSGNESHWKDWFKNPNSEAARLGYVACSRPKHLLIMAVKKVNKTEQKELESKGFLFV